MSSPEYERTSTEGSFEPFGYDYDGALHEGVFLRFPGQWDDESWSSSRAESGYYNVFRWLSPTVGSYLRPDPLGVLGPGGTRPLFLYANGNPVFYFDSNGLDALTSDPDIQECLFCLLKSAGYGSSKYESAAWIVPDAEGSPCVGWPPSGKVAKQEWKGPLPEGTSAQAHTHPTRSRETSLRGPRPSGNDRRAFDKLGMPVYTVTPQGIWKYDPETGLITQEEDSGWYKAPKRRCKKKKCEVPVGGQ